MSSIDERVVEMKFKDSEFQTRVQSTMDALAKLKNNLKMDGAARGLQEVTRGTGQLEGTASNVANSFTAMSAVVFGALASIGAKAVSVGSQVVKALTIAPVTAGMQEYETNLNSIQTILSNTQAAGKGLPEVSAALDELNTYSDKTIYNFSEMARNIGTFTAAGVGLDQSVAAIKGIANLAALSGSNSEKASGAMYQLSQALAAGRVSLMDWNSVVNAGMGGTVFQRTLAQTAVAMGELNGDAVKLTGEMQNVTISGQSFRDSISASGDQKSWLSAEVLTNALSLFTGDLSDAEIKAMGFKDEQIAGIQQMAKSAMHAATEVKTLSGVFDTAKEVAGSGWARTWQLIFGNFTEAKTLFTDLSNYVNDFINSSAKSRNELLANWKLNGGREVVINAITTGFQNLLAILNPVREAFRDVFPATTVTDLMRLSQNFRQLMRSLKPSAATLVDIRRTFRGLFSILGIGIDLIKAAFHFFGDLFGIITKGGGNLLYFTGNVGDFIYGLRAAIQEGGYFTKFFESLTNILRGPIEFIKALATAFFGLFDGLDSNALDDTATTLGDITDNFTRIGNEAADAWQRFVGVLDRFWRKIEPFRKGVKEFFQDAGNALGDFLSGLSFGDILAGVGTGAFAALMLSIRKFIKNFDLNDLFGQSENFIGNIKDLLDQLTDTLQAMQNALNASALLGIAIAIGVLAVSVALLAHLDDADMTRAVVAIGLLMAQLAGAAFVLSKLKPKETAKLIVLGIALVAFAIAVRVLAKAVERLSALDWNELTKGLLGVMALLAMILGFSRYIKVDQGKLISIGIGMVAFAFAIKILASAVADLSDLGWDQIAEGLLGVAALLTALGLFTRFSRVNSIGVRSGAGIVLLSASIKILASALKDISKLSWANLAEGMSAVVVSLAAFTAALRFMPARNALGKGVAVVLMAASMFLVGMALKKVAEIGWTDILKGLLVMTVALGAMTLALKFIPRGAIFSAAAVIGMSAAMLIIAIALEKVGKMDWSGIAKALVGIGAIMLVIGLFIAAMVATEGVGAVLLVTLAASLIVIAGALYIMSLALERMGAMSWSDIGAAIGQLGLLFVVLAIGGALSPAIGMLAIALTALAAAIAIAGGGILMAGIGIAAFASAMDKLSKIDAESVDNIVNALSRLIGLLPLLGTAAADAVVAFTVALGEGAGDMAAAFSKITDAFVQTITEDTPKVVAAFGEMIVKCLDEMSRRAPDMANKGADLIVNVLNGITRNMPRVSAAGASAIAAFLSSIGKSAGKVSKAGAQMIIDLLNGIADTIRTKGPELRAAGGNLVGSIFDGMFGGVDKNEPSLMERFRSMALNALTSAAKALGVGSPSKKFMELGQYSVQGFIKGLQGNRAQIDAAVVGMTKKISDVMYDAKQRSDAAGRSLEHLYKARKKDWAEIQRQQQIQAQANVEYAKANAAQIMLTRNLAGHTNKLRQLAAAEDAVIKKIDAANEKLADAKKTRDDYFNSIKDQYDDLPEITGRTNLTKYMADFQRQIDDTQSFATAIQELRKRGLNDTMYKELLAKGPEAMPFIQQILAQGIEGVNKLNVLGVALDKVAGDLGKSASTSLYQAGVDAAQGLVDGLKKQQKQIEDYMRWLATVMVNAIKKQLGIRSPSKIMQDIGVQTAEGMAKGLQDSSAVVAKSAEMLGGSAIDGMRKTLAGLGALISEEMDSNPTISPVLDLNGVRKDVSVLNSMLAVKPIDIQDQIQRAKDAAAGLRDNQATFDEIATAGAGDHFNFTQNNYSPKALSSGEIYRQTNNQLSRAKGALATNAK